LGEAFSCRLRAVPAGAPAPTAGLASFSGPRTGVGFMDTSTAGPVTYDFYAIDPQLTAADDYNSFGSCGLADSYVMDPIITAQVDSFGFFCNDWSDNPTASSETRPGVEISGQPAYAPAQAQSINSGAPGQPSLTINSITFNPANGDFTLSETEPFVFCSGNPFPPDSTDCLSFSPTGVEVRRTITQTDGGHIVYVQDSFSSTDGASHPVSLLLENDQFFRDLTETLGSNVSYEFPGQSTFAPGTPGEVVDVPPAAPASILVQNSTLPDGSPTGPRGAITYGQLPSGSFVFTPNTLEADAVFDAPNSFTVPASGSVPIRYAYSTEITSAKAIQDALTAEDQFQAPVVSLRSPARGSLVDSSPVTVRGTESAGSGVKKVTVNGITATLTGGSFSASVPLKGGANTLTAVLTSKGGATARATETVILATKPGATTGKAKAIKNTSAILTGTVTPGSVPTKYAFEYGRSATYGKTTAARTVSTAGAVSVRLTGLKPHAKYHFRLTASDSAGTSDGNDRTLTTAKPSPRRLTAHVSPHSDVSAPYRFTISGALTPAAGVTRKSACKGSVVATVANGKRRAATKRIKLSSRCRYSGRLSFSAAALPGTGKLSFAVAFTGNKVLAARAAKVVSARFG
jgi:hypothetical protein